MGLPSQQGLLSRQNAGDWEHLRYRRGRCTFLTPGPVLECTRDFLEKAILTSVVRASLLGPSPRSPAQLRSSARTWERGSWRRLCSQHPPVQRYILGVGTVCGSSSLSSVQKRGAMGCYNGTSDVLLGAGSGSWAWLCLVSPSSGVYSFAWFV